MMSALSRVQTHIEAAHTKRLYIEDTESICYSNKFIENSPNYNIAPVYTGWGIIKSPKDQLKQNGLMFLYRNCLHMIEELLKT